ncbi:MAG: hypothetical protein KatS3mg031_2211 [Chitinophagales bacterium]|nr:MAG: hypothetical protein KatS3mg031_2211 [Chitinophagales bacterium]
MKRNYFTATFILSMVIGGGLWAQTIPVSQTIEKKNAILELYSGIHCQFCPRGDKIANELQAAHPGDFIIIDIQAGSYAVPNPGEPDYRTPFGTSLLNQSGLTGYPAGSINRHVFPGLGQGTNSIAMSTNNWSTATNQILSENSPANLGVEATFDVQTRELTVRVQVYYTAIPPVNSGRINVAILQNNLIGPQIIGAGVETDPNLVLPNGDYIHNHVLRHLMTGQYGDVIQPVTAGSFFDRTYTYTVGDSIYEIPVVLNDLEIVAFISEGPKEIYTGHAIKPTFVNFPHAYDVNLVSAQMKDAPFCGYNGIPKVRIQNYGSQPVSSLDIVYSINGSPQKTYNWTGFLNPIEETEVTLPDINFFPQDTNQLVVEIKNPNGQTDGDANNNRQVIDFLPAPNVSNAITMVLQMDYYGSEITWYVVNSGNDTLYSGGPYQDDPDESGPLPTPITETFTLPGGDCYRFIAKDSYGDGILGSNTGFLLRDENFVTIVSGFASYGYEGVVHFGINPPQPDSSQVFPVGIHHIPSEEVLIFPNPANGKVRLVIRGLYQGIAEVAVVNTLGQSLITRSGVQVEALELDVSALAPGVYLLQIHSASGKFTGKLLVGF